MLKKHTGVFLCENLRVLSLTFKLRLGIKKVVAKGLSTRLGSMYNMFPPMVAPTECIHIKLAKFIIGVVAK